MDRWTDRRMDRWTDRRMDRRTDMKKLIVAFSNFATAPKNETEQLKYDTIPQILRCLFQDFCNIWKKVIDKITPEPFWRL
jgi:hypothetical protein